MQLNTAQSKCVKRVRSAKSWIIRKIFNLESQIFSWTLVIHADLSSATPDMKSWATSSRHLSKFEKGPKMLPTMALGHILVAWRFSWPNQLVGFLLNLLYSTCHLHHKCHNLRRTAKQQMTTPIIGKYYRLPDYTMTWCFLSVRLGHDDINQSINQSITKLMYLSKFTTSRHFIKPTYPGLGGNSPNSISKAYRHKFCFGITKNIIS